MPCTAKPHNSIAVRTARVVERRGAALHEYRPAHARIASGIAMSAAYRGPYENPAHQTLYLAHAIRNRRDGTTIVQRRNWLWCQQRHAPTRENSTAGMKMINPRLGLMTMPVIPWSRLPVHAPLTPCVR